MNNKDELDTFVLEQGEPKVAEDPRSDAQIDKLLGLAYCGPSERHTWPRAALGVDAAGRKATPAELKGQNTLPDTDKEPK